MKKILLILIASCVMLIAGTAKSQVTNLANSFGVTYNLISNTGYLGDTTIDVSTHYLKWPVKVTGYYKVCVVNLVDINISGTSTLTATLQHSCDSINWFTVPTDSVIAISGTSSVGWKWVDYGDQIVRVKVVSSGTGHTRIQGSMILRKPIEITQ